MALKILLLTKPAQNLEFVEGETWEAALARADLSVSNGYSVSLNGREPEQGEVLKDGDMLVVAPKVDNGQTP